MKEITDGVLTSNHFILFIYSPFCGTCHLAKSILTKIESIHRQDIFYEMNASLHPDFMYGNKIESVPCLLIKDKNEIKERVYAFKSVQNIYSYLLEYEPTLFVQSD